MTLVGAVAVAVALLAGAAGSEAATVHPVPGHYVGEDSYLRPISFTLNPHGAVTDFKVGTTPFPIAHIQGSEWGQTCQKGFCTKGRWISSFAVFGHWSFGGPEISYEANLLALYH